MHHDPLNLWSSIVELSTMTRSVASNDELFISVESRCPCLGIISANLTPNTDSFMSISFGAIRKATFCFRCVLNYFIQCLCLTCKYEGNTCQI